MLTPVLAFAASVIGFDSLSYRDGKVTGTVYTDVYTNNVNGSVYLDVYSPYGAALSTAATATYSTYKDGKYYYNFSTNITNGYSYATVKATVYDPTSVTGSTYLSTSKDVTNTSSTTSTGSYGGGGWIGGNNNSSVTVPVSGDVSAFDITNAFNNALTVTLNISGDYATVPASALLEAAKKPGAVLVVSSQYGSFILPLSVLKFDDLAKQAKTEVANLKIKVTVAKVADATAVTTAAAALGGNVVANAIDFNVEAVGASTVSVNFSGTYVSRTINLDKVADSKKTTAVVYDAASKKISFVPATFETKDGKSVATIKRNSSSVYTLVEFNKSFNDIATHWAKADVELLANKLVVDGVTNTTFVPERNITRAEFAALVVRALGLNILTPTSAFKDVNSSEWYAGVVTTATVAGIVDGYEDGTYRPNAQITREELAAMVVRALKYAGVNTDITSTQQSAALAAFKDSNKIVWAQKRNCCGHH